jgi:hypothetical protein
MGQALQYSLEIQRKVLGSLYYTNRIAIVCYRSRCRWEDDVKMDLKKVCENVDLIFWSRIGTNCGLF